MKPRPGGRSIVPAAIAALLILLLLNCRNDLPSERGAESETRAPTGAQIRFAFWNVQNLFDAEDDPRNPGDDEFLPARGWTAERYAQKIERLAAVIATLEPHLLALCEIENLAVLEALARSAPLAPFGYRIIHDDSADPRGIDTAFLYRAPLAIADPRDIAVHQVGTRMREILEANFTHDGRRLTAFVTHWTSRISGEEASDEKRARYARTLRDVVLNRPAEADLLILGDFNDEPFDDSVREVLGAVRNRRAVLENRRARYLYNPMWKFYARPDGGTHYYNDEWEWSIFDQCIVSKGMLLEEGYSLDEDALRIHAPDTMRDRHGRPHGASDHFPITGALNVR